MRQGQITKMIVGGLMVLVFSLNLVAAIGVSAKDWPQWCGSDGKNMVSDEKGLPESFSPGRKRSDGTIDLSTATNVKWGVRLGDAFYSTPSVAGGKVYVGGLDEQGRDLRLLRCRHRQSPLAMEGRAAQGAAQDRRLFDRHQRHGASRLAFAHRRRSKAIASISFPTALRWFAWMPPARKRRPATPESCGRSTCGRNWACFPAMPRTVRR